MAFPSWTLHCGKACTPQILHPGWSAVPRPRDRSDSGAAAGSSSHVARSVLRCPHRGSACVRQSLGSSAEPVVTCIPGGGEGVPPKTAGLVPRARSAAAAGRPGHSGDPGDSLTGSGSSHGGQALHVGAVAPRGMAALLAVDVEASRPATIPRVLRRLIVEMARANRPWGAERIADELLLKLGVTVSPRTVRRYLWLATPPRKGVHARQWSMFVCRQSCPRRVGVQLRRDRHRELPHASRLRCDGGRHRRIVHWSVTAHPTAAWTTQQFRAAVTGERLEESKPAFAIRRDNREHRGRPRTPVLRYSGSICTRPRCTNESIVSRTNWRVLPPSF